MEEREKGLGLVDLIDMDILQRLQDSLHKVLGISTGVSDTEGVAVTSHSSWTNFCNQIKGTKRGLAACENCDKHGMLSAMESGYATTYNCHAGLIDFAVPIIVDEKPLGCFLGGQVTTEPLTRKQVDKLARRYEVDSDELWEGAQEIRIVDADLLDQIAAFVHDIVNIVSQQAFQKHQLHNTNIEMERAVNMQSDFLANMSHEIRTPMNAVIGMAEMALREELPPAARDYVAQIISSGKTLLTIINDILDFSKIESGKLNISEYEYEPMSILNDVSNMITTRIGDKELELIIDMDPTLPFKLWGDCIRIKQVIVNLANNAVKFTKKGRVLLKIAYEKKSEDMIELQVSVQDTGLGIKKEDMKQLFQSFYQLDSKRNRNIEGTGLGLAISKQLLTLMGGNIWVESEYGVGSTFSFSLPQKIMDEKPSISLKEDVSIVCGLVDNPYVKEQLLRDVRHLGDVFKIISSVDELANMNCEGVTHLFVDHALFSERVQRFIREHEDIVGVLMVNFNTTLQYNIPNLVVVKKPLYALNVATILNHEDIHTALAEEGEDFDFAFVAPEASVLVVDDNQVNLTVAVGLLKPLEMQIDTATGGKEAIDKISVKHYDLIFMDHMMPEIDGVETTHLIRRFHPEYNEVPIIALTANAIGGTREMFMQEGMNDFVAKPIELRVITDKLKYWLPKEKIQKIKKDSDIEDMAEVELPVIEIAGLNTEYSLKMLGSEELFWEVLRDYYNVIEKKAEQIRQLKDTSNWPNYTVEVHALKSASRQIGAMELADLAAKMEAAGNTRDKDQIRSCTDEMLEMYLGYKEILEPYMKEEGEMGSRGAIGTEDLRALFDEMREALEELDMDKMGDVAKEISQYQYGVEQAELLEQLLAAVEDIDVDTCEDVILAWEVLL